MQSLVPVQVDIQNFQSIAHVKLEIRGFVVVVGKSNVGKSAIIRAISSCLLNLPVVGAVRKGTSHVKLHIQNGENEILWEKGEKKINRYTINGKLYDKVERKQLPEITSMGFGSVEVGDSRMQPWWASQFEPIFLLNKTGPQVTDFISEVSRLQVVQTAISLSARGKKRENDQVKNCEEDMITVEDEIEKYEELDKLDSLWADIQAMRDSILEYESKLDKMKSIYSSLHGYKDRIEQIQESSRVSVPDLDLSLQIETLQKRKEAYASLQKLTREILQYRKISEIGELELPQEEFDRFHAMRAFSSLPVLSRQVQKLSDVESLSVPEVDLSEECSRLGSMRKFQSDIQRHAAGIQKYRHVIPVLSESASDDIAHEVARIASMQATLRILTESRKEIDRLELESQSVNKTYNEVVSELSNFSSCPLCGQELSHDHSAEKSAGEI